MLCPGTGRKGGIYPASVIISGFLPGHPPCCGFRSGLPGPPPQNTTVKPAAGRFIRYTQHIAGQPTGQDMLNTLTDQIHFHRRKRAPRFTMASSTTGRFSSSSSSQQGDRFPSRPGESGASGGSATSDRWWSAPHGYAAHLLPPVTDASYRIVHRIKNSPDFVFGQPFSGIREDTCVRLPEVPAATATDCRTVPVPPRFRSVSEWRRP